MHTAAKKKRAKSFYPRSAKVTFPSILFAFYLLVKNFLLAPIRIIIVNLYCQICWWPTSILGETFGGGGKYFWDTNKCHPI